MEARLQRRVQRYGWDKAVSDYETGWRAQLEPAQSMMLEMAEPRTGQRVLDVACGTGLGSFRALEAVGASGAVLGTDISARMIEAARSTAKVRGVKNATFQRADAEALGIEADAFDAALCALGLMYVPNPDKALVEMGYALKSGGRAAAVVWGARANCGWAEIFSITNARVASEVCPLFFQLGPGDVLAQRFAEAEFTSVQTRRLHTELVYRSEEEALCAAFRGGPVALAYNRFDDSTRAAVHAEYLHSIEPFRSGDGFRIPSEYVAAVGVKP